MTLMSLILSCVDSNLEEVLDRVHSHLNVALISNSHQNLDT